MKHRLPILTAMMLGIVGAVASGLLTAKSSRGRKDGSEAPPFAGAAVAQAPAAGGVIPASAEAPVPATAPGAPAGGPTLTPPPVPGVPPAADLLRRSIDQLALYESLSAKLRFHGNLYEETLSGTGQYLQSGHAPIRLRLELKMPMGDDVCTLQQVCDGNALWIRRTLFGAVRLGRVDVQRVIDARQARLVAAPPGPGAPTKELAIGGLPMLVDGVRRAFDLETVVPATVGKTQAHKISGMLKPALLAQLLLEQKPPPEPGQPPNLKALALHAPTHVELYIGVDDLFPYKLDFKRIVDGKTSLDDAPVMYSVEFYDVERNITLDPVQFVFQPGETPSADDTDIFISRQ